MVIGEKDEKQPGAATQQNMPPASIDNIMSGISNTGTVKMNNHRKKLRQRYASFSQSFLQLCGYPIQFIIL